MSCKHKGVKKQHFPSGMMYCYRCWVEYSGKEVADKWFDIQERNYLPFYIERRHFFTAYKKGQDARIKGLPRDSCPYPDWTTGYRNGVTFSRAWRKAWFAGWESFG